MITSRNSNRFLIGTETSLSQKGIIKMKENIPIQPQQAHNFFLYNIHPEKNKMDTN